MPSTQASLLDSLITFRPSRFVVFLSLLMVDLFAFSSRFQFQVDRRGRIPTHEAIGRSDSFGEGVT